MNLRFGQQSGGNHTRRLPASPAAPDQPPSGLQPLRRRSDAEAGPASVLPLPAARRVMAPVGTIHTPVLPKGRLPAARGILLPAAMLTIFGMAVVLTTCRTFAHHFKSSGLRSEPWNQAAPPRIWKPLC